MKTNLTVPFIATLCFLGIAATLTAIDYQSPSLMYAGFINFIFAIGCLIYLLIRRLAFKKKTTRLEWITLLALFNVSCFSLNEEVNLFSPQSKWVIAGLGGLYAFLIIEELWEHPPQWLTWLSRLFYGLGIFLSGYFSIYMLPIFPLGIMAIAILGLGLHVFVPPALFTTLLMMLKDKTQTPVEKTLTGIGAIFPIIISVMLATQWGPIVYHINRTDTEGDFPKWLKVAQIIPESWAAKQLLIGDFKYDFISNLFRVNNFGMPNWDSGRTHDPVFNFANLIVGKPDLTAEERLKILKTALNSRHLTERKLWTGRNLTTAKEKTSIELYPQYRIAYTEKTFWIKNHSHETNDFQEALFTFQLPEGAVASAMSLWVNGEERPSRLTTKEKADQAYVSIVGRERRDPALLHWQEGNRLTLTVFPCTNKELRQVKVGFTVPLKLQGEELIYEEVVVEGPHRSGPVDIEVVFQDQDNSTFIPKWLQRTGARTYTYQGWAKPNWSIKMVADLISDEPFTFLGKCYQLAPAIPQPRSISLQNFYLDLNQNWDKATFKKILSLTRQSNVFVFKNGAFIQLKESNQWQLFEELTRNRFSVFPIHKIPQPASSLLITHNGMGTPFLSDLDELGTQMDLGVGQWTSPLKVFCLSEDLPGYMRQFAAQSEVLVAFGNVLELEKSLNQKLFPVYAEVDRAVVLSVNGTKIKQIEDCTQNIAPDHLLRLFNYNQILKKLALKDTTNQQEMIFLANEAFVVSPVSSLIVLETEKDYERFDIDVNEKSLQNAAKKDAGAAPEPHEWALIILCSVFLLWWYRRN